MDGEMFEFENYFVPNENHLTEHSIVAGKSNGTEMVAKITKV